MPNNCSWICTYVLSPPYLHRSITAFSHPYRSFVNGNIKRDKIPLLFFFFRFRKRVSFSCIASRKNPYIFFPATVQFWRKSEQFRFKFSPSTRRIDSFRITVACMCVCVCTQSLEIMGGRITEEARRAQRMHESINNARLKSIDRSISPPLKFSRPIYRIAQGNTATFREDTLFKNSTLLCWLLITPAPVEKLERGIPHSRPHFRLLCWHFANTAVAGSVLVAVCQAATDEGNCNACETLARKLQRFLNTTE